MNDSRPTTRESCGGILSGSDITTGLVIIAVTRVCDEWLIPDCIVTLSDGTTHRTRYVAQVGHQWEPNAKAMAPSSNYPKTPDMKYIVTKQENGTEEIFIFPRAVNHKVMAQAVKRLKHHCEPISAGFVEGGKCVGNSESLMLASRPEDTALLPWMNDLKISDAPMASNSNPNKQDVTP